LKFQINAVRGAASVIATHGDGGSQEKSRIRATSKPMASRKNCGNAPL
jgi:hypothetical protein